MSYTNFIDNIKSKSLVKKGIPWHRILWCLIIALIPAISIWPNSSLPAAAQSVEEYLQVSYDPVSFSQNKVHGSEVFYATIHGKATCVKDLPLSAGEASITSRVIAQHIMSGSKVTLNSSDTVTIKPFPSKEGDSTEINQLVTLQFPAHAESGRYSIIGELIEAKVKIGFVWGEVTEYLPQSQLMGSLEYVSPGPPPTSSPAAPAPTATPALSEPGIAWWVWLIIAVAVTTTTVNIICLLRYRAKKRYHQ